MTADPLRGVMFRIVDDLDWNLPDRFAGGGDHRRTSTWLDEGTGCVDPAGAGASPLAVCIVVII